MRFFVDVETVSEANARGRFWAGAKRAKAQREAVTEALALLTLALPEDGPFYVRLTRVSRGKLDDDNLGRALKTVRDTIAAALKIDDGDDAIVFRPTQEKLAKGETRGVRVEIWGGGSCPS